MASPEAADKLERALEKFKAVAVRDITDVYDYHPNYLRSKLGSGSYGDAFRMKSKDNPKEELRVVKIMPKLRVTRNVLQVHHVCAEIAVTTLLHNEYLNRAVAVYHSPDYLYIVLELCEAPFADPRTRVYHLFARYCPARIADVEEMVTAWEKECPGNFRTAGDFYDDKINEILMEGPRRQEAPRGTDLFNLIVFHRRIPDRKAAIILKQALQGLEFMHWNQVVHRDIKTENLVVEEVRKAEPLRGDDGRVIGVRFHETMRCKLIDFNLVKYLALSQWPTSPSPDVFSQSANPFAGDIPTNPPALPQAVSVTPCGTELYCALEVITGILDSGFGQTKWVSDLESLPKLDIYGCGTMMFCMANGRPPFKAPPSVQGFRPVSREEKMRQVQQLIAAGPVFSMGVSDAAKKLILRLMHNDPKMRPSATEALKDDFLKGIGRTYTYDVMCDGRVSVVVEAATSAEGGASSSASATAVSSSIESAAENTSASPTGGEGGHVGEDADKQQQEDLSAHDADDYVMTVMRGKEDRGDAAGKEAS